MPPGDQDHALASSRRDIQQPTILVLGLKPERLVDSEGRIDAFLEPPTQEQARAADRGARDRQRSPPGRWVVRLRL